jgi:hypothetical protein
MAERCITVALRSTMWRAFLLPSCIRTGNHKMRAMTRPWREVSPKLGPAVAGLHWGTFGTHRRNSQASGPLSAGGVKPECLLVMFVAEKGSVALVRGGRGDHEALPDLQRGPS